MTLTDTGLYWYDAEQGEVQHLHHVFTASGRLFNLADPEVRLMVARLRIVADEMEGWLP